MSKYGTHRWTCGRCGESYEATDMHADLMVHNWARAHRWEQHMTAAQRTASSEATPFTDQIARAAAAAAAGTHVR